jgi:amino acid adenylation domain-containing protein
MTASLQIENVPGNSGAGEPALAQDEGFRLSPQQLRIWLLERAGEAPLSVGCAVRIEGDLDPSRLERALLSTVARQEILRTTFGFLPGLSAPVQRVHAEATPEFTRVDLSALASEEAERRLEQRLVDLAGRPFDLERGPLLRLLLVALQPSRHALLICQPALCADATGLQNLVAEVARTYAALPGGEVMDDEPLQYADFAEWQNQAVEAEEGEPERQWWRRQDVSPGFEQSLACDNPEGALRRFEPLTSRLPVAAGLVARCGERAASQGQSLEVFLLACWQAFLWRHLGASPVVACCFGGRGYEELRGALGVMQRYLPVRCDIAGGLPFQGLLAETGRTFDEAAKAQEHFSWEGLGSSPAGSPPFLPNAFEFRRQTELPIAAGLSWRVDRCCGETERFHLKLAGRELGGAITCELVHDAAAVGGEDAGRLARGFAALLASAVELPADRPLRALDFLAAAERRQLIVELNATRRDRPQGCCLHELIERQAGQAPDRLALISAQREMTFSELDARADRLAHRLRAMGVGPEVLVAVCTARSPEMVVGLLGVLKAGAAYLPLDPEYPRERLSFLLENSGAQLVLTTGDLDQGLTQRLVRVVRLDAAGEGDGGEAPVARPVSGVTADNLAYVIYTSGSTGRPKGVQISHRAILNRLLWMQEETPLGADDRVLQKTPFSFDASIWEIFLPLMTGAGLVLAAPGGHQDPEYLIHEIVERQVTVLQMVPSLLRMLLEQPELERCRSLRRVFCGGEALPVDLQNRLLARLPVRLYNLYGPTEVSIDASSWHCSPGSQGAIVPIGRPITNTRIFLLDSHRELIPFGATGEICVGGSGLARGYLSRPDLTAEKFVPDPFGGEPGQRLYRTGDLGRYRLDGALEYRGRMDQQVKVRGFRIELEEIEAVLCDHPAVREAVVVAREEAPGDVRLAGYVTVGEEGVPPSELRRFLGEKLPEHMIPATLTELASMPRTPNGKLDRAALPGVDAGPARRTAVVSARNTTEDLVAAIWASVLGLEVIGIHDDFFELGGHSLLATQVVVRLRDAFQVELPLRDLFEAPTVAQLATRLQALLHARRGLQMPPIVHVSREGELPLSFGQQRLWFIHQLDPGSPAYNIPDAFFARGRLDIAALERALSEIVRRHEVLRAVFLEDRGRPVQVLSPRLSWCLPIIDLQGLERDRREALASQLTDQEIHRSFDLARGPLFRGCVLRLAANEHVVVLAVHHIVSDGWSTGLLVREMVVLYGAFTQSRPSPLAELPIQYADFAAWQRSWLQGEVLERQLEYWRRHMAGAAPVLELPFDHRRPVQQTFRGAYQAMSLPADLTLQLKQFSRRQGATLYMTLLAAFDTLLSRYTNCDDIVVGAPIANRTRVETESLIGFFVNTLVLRNDLSGDPPYQDLLVRAREVVLAASTFQDLPFDRLVEELQPDRGLDRPPVFQVIFVLQNAPRQGLELPGLELRPSAVRHLSLQFDLDVTLWEQADAIGGGFVYSPDLFERSTILRMIDHFHRLLESAVADPGRRLSELPLLSSSERVQLLLEWNDTSSPVDAGSDVWHLFERQVARTPEAVAVACEGESLSYGDLWRRVDRVARSLAGRLAPEGVVAVLAERGIGLLTAMLGIFRAGGVYLPLDPLYPDGRIVQVLGQSGARILLLVDPLQRTVDSVLESLPAGRRPSVARLSELAAAGEEAGVTLSWPSPERLAYVIYTSGSTGSPKGVMVTHGGMLNHLNAKLLDLDLTAADGVAQTAAQTFDISIWQFLAALLAGGRVEVFRDDTAHDPRLLLRAVESARISVLETVPSLLRVAIDEIARAGSPPSLGVLRWLLVTGEALPPSLCARWLELYPQTPLLNAYGPTECSDDVTHALIAHPPDSGRASAPLGFPIVNTQIHILDARARLTPTGVPGELCVGGAGVGRGYLDEPDRTARVFVPDPFAPVPGERLYRTGDLARYLPDGSLEFLGRLDHQVKVHGFRIELGEIEAALAQHPAVLEAVVLAREDTPGQLRLVAYVVAGETQPTSVSLRGFLEARLPAYMVPGAFVQIAGMPLTTAGKIDRRALPAPEEPAGGPDLVFIPPSTPVEQILAGIWSEVLSVERVGIHDEFFDIGGHSLLATQVLSRIRETFRMDLTVRVMFEATTIEQMAGVLVAREPQPGQAEKIARAMLKLRSMSAEKKRELLQAKRAGREGARLA